MPRRKLYKPEFWGAEPQSGPYRGLLNYRRVWWLTIIVLLVVSIAPLLVMSFLDFNATRHALMSENTLRTERTTSNTRRSVAHFLDQRRSALELIANTATADELKDPAKMQEVLNGLKKSFGGFIDLGLISCEGTQVTYVGPYNLTGKDYSDQSWLTSTRESGSFISDVFFGFRKVPHLIIAVKFPGTDASKGCILRATLDTQQFNSILSGLDLSGDGDAFLINTAGVVQTPSRGHGGVLEQLNLPVPKYAEHTQTWEGKNNSGKNIIAGYAYIENTPFVLLVVKSTDILMQPWHNTRLQLLGMLAISIAVIILVVFAVSTYMMNSIHAADNTRVRTMQKMEHTNRMASIGRLAAGVAHEINNPLAIINEKAGLMHDLFTYSKEYDSDPRLMGLLDSIIHSVERCGAITKRLLGFARQSDVQSEALKVPELVDSVLGFLTKEAEYRSIEIDLHMPEGLPLIHSDRGKLQQIFLNLISNAFQAMSDGGNLSITATTIDCNKGYVCVSISDDGCGIPLEDQKRIFEPFFSTKKTTGGTGLGLSITYGLLSELGGSLALQSRVGEGTTFTVKMPVAEEQA
ncbi:MAG: sensor histidine kinase [Desulfovibrio sp.]